MRNLSITDKLARCRISMITNQPFYGVLAMSLPLIEARVLPGGHVCNTMATDMRRIFYNPEFVESMTESETIFVIAHEVLHVAYKHGMRRGGRDPKLWNIAGDLRINTDLIAAGFRRPSMGIFDDAGLYKDMSTEEIYAALAADPGAMPKLPKPGKGQESDDGDPGGTGAALDAGPEDKGETGEGGSTEELAEKSDRDLQAAARAAVKGNKAGQIPAGVARIIAALQKPTEDWRSRLSRFISDGKSTDYSYARPNKRFLQSGLIMPGFVPTRPNKVIFCIDSSGSIGEAELTLCASELQGALDMAACDRIVTVWADTKAYPGDDYDTGDIIALEAKGGGGTHFDAVMTWAAEHHPDAAGMVFFTDLMTASWGKEPPFPVIWAAHGAESTVRAHTPPYGELIHIRPWD